MPERAPSPAQVLALFERHASHDQRACLDHAAELARESGSPLYLVGGASRDLLRDGPIHDLDLVVEADGPGFARSLAERLEAELKVHEAFGTAELETHGLRIDVAGARRETYSGIAALPVVRPGTLVEDLARRDFTVNALAIRLAPDEAGRLEDPYGGLEDLRSGLLRALHARSFHDDPTRALRGARLEMRLGMRLETTTTSWLARALEEGVFARLSGDRLGRELELIFRQLPDPRAAVGRLAELGLLAAIHPALGLEAPAPDRLVRLHEARFRLLEVIEQGGETDWLRCGLMVLGWDLEPDTRRAVAERAGLAGEPLRRVVDGPPHLARVVERLDRRDLTPHEAEEGLGPLSSGELLLVAAGSARAASWVERFVREWRGLTLQIRGADLVAQGFSPGPEIGRVLAATRRARVDGWITAADELAFALEVASSGRPAPIDEGAEDPES